MIFQTCSKIRKLLELQILQQDFNYGFYKNTNLSIEEISENKTSGNELSVTKISDSTAEKHLQIMLLFILLQTL